MSGRVCYIARAGGGERMTSVRLLGPRGEELWQAPTTAPDSIAILAETGQAAAWIASRAGRAGIGQLVVDVGGGECRWVSAPANEPAVVAAALSAMEEAGSSGRALDPTWGIPTMAEASVQTLAPSDAPAHNGRQPPQAQGQRIGALAIPDVSPRLLLDALDERGIPVHRVASLWHALAQAWDPPAPRASDENIVATSAPATAIVLADPVGRLIWAWSRAGELLAGGTVRLPLRPGLQIGRAEVGRLTADWLSWSVQLGAAPGRILVISPALEGGADALSPAELGERLGRGWPGATVDLAVHEDPVGATLARLADTEDEREVSTDDGRQALLALTQRPGRAHRAMYRWVALVMLIAAAALTAIAWKAWSRAGDARSKARDAREATGSLVLETTGITDPIQQETALADPAFFLSRELQAKEQMVRGTGLTPAKPILAELDALSYVLSNPDLKITDLTLDSSGVLVSVQVPDTRTGEELIANMGSIAGSSVAEWSADWGTAPEGTARSVLLKGKWASGAATPAEPAP